MSGRPGFYERHVLPRLIGCACSQPVMARLRAEVVPQARGAVFELGCGGGLNQPFYRPEQISRFVGIDPNLALLDAARWIDLGMVQFQPSEIAKGTLIITVALILSVQQTEKGIAVKETFKLTDI